MTGETFWQLFTDTGDPMSWLMYRAAERPPRDEDKKPTPKAPSGPSD